MECDKGLLGVFISVLRPSRYAAFAGVNFLTVLLLAEVFETRGGRGTVPTWGTKLIRGVLVLVFSLTVRTTN